jgi:hypothetical protein
MLPIGLVNKVLRPLRKRRQLELTDHPFEHMCTFDEGKLAMKKSP